MKTKRQVRRNDRPSATEIHWRRAIHVLMDATDDGLILMADESVPVFIVPAILDDESSERESSDGVVEYQVSDGLPGKRSTSHDFYHLHEAVEEFQRIQREGWK